MSEVGVELQARVEQIREALTRAGDRFDPELTRRAHEDLDRVLHRLELGVDHSVVALVGGTGSGKSSMFNSLTTLAFADVGVIRPTTSQAAACVWGDRADTLLDFLQVARERRILRESALTGSDEAEMRGLVLLDLPDHDSIATGHAELVNRLLPLIDLLIWVVDPQKYADNALHEGYLRELQDRHEAMLVVVNQIDTLTDAGQRAVRDDVQRLLAEDGLADVPVILASARTGAGVSDVRDTLRSVMRAESIAARTARDEIGAITRRVSTALSAREPELPTASATAEQLADAAGVPAVTQSIRDAVASPSVVALSAVQRPARSRIDAIRESWIGDATTGLPSRWRQAVATGATAAEDFFEHTAAALEGVPQPSSRDESAARMRLMGMVLLGVGAALLVAGGVVYLLEVSTLLAIVLGGASVLAAVVGVVLVLSARSRRRRSSIERAERYRADVIAAVAAVVTSDLLQPTTAVLADHEAVRRGALASR